MKNSFVKIFSSLLLMVFVLFSAQSMAQKSGKYGATADDSVKCVEALSVYKDFLRENKYKEAKNYWGVAFSICPGSSLKMYVDGEKILKGLIKENKDNKERVAELVDTLLLLYDVRIQHFNKEGYVLGKKGATMYKYKTPSYEEAYNTLKKSIQLDGNKAQAAAIIYYFQAASKIYDPEKHGPEFWVEMFNQCVGIIDYNLANGPPKTVKAYASAMDAVIKIADPYLTCDVLVGFYKDRYEEKKEDALWLESAAEILDKKDCSDSPIFFTIANQLHTMDPSAASAKSMGIMSMKKTNYSDAVKFFKEAIDLADDVTDDENLDQKLAELELLLAKAYFGAKNYTASRTHAQKAAEYRSGWGEPYMLIGDLYAGSVSMCEDTDGHPDKSLKTPYWAAVDMYQKAKSVDTEVASDASQKIAKYSQYFPEKGDAFFHGLNDGASYTVKCWLNVTTTVRTR